MSDKPTTVATPMEQSGFGGSNTGSGMDKPLSINSPMDTGNASMNPSSGGTFNGEKGYGFGAFQRTAGATGPAEKIYEDTKQGNTSVKSPNMTDSDIPRK